MLTACAKCYKVSSLIFRITIKVINWAWISWNYFIPVCCLWCKCSQSAACCSKAFSVPRLFCTEALDTAAICLHCTEQLVRALHSLSRLRLVPILWESLRSRGFLCIWLCSWKEGVYTARGEFNGHENKDALALDCQTEICKVSCMYRWSWF